MAKTNSATFQTARYRMHMAHIIGTQQHVYEILTTEFASMHGLREVEAMLILGMKKTTLDYLQPQSTKN